jgi:surface protein/VCBS repeat-containing protein
MKNIYSLLLIGLLSFCPLMNAQQNPNFTLHTNGVTCLCPNAANLETGDVNGVTYTKRTKEQITPQNAATTCTSGITDMSALFYPTNFNGNISSWDVSSVTNMRAMFFGTNFNQPIGNWDVSNVTDMHEMFTYNTSFNQPINNWNVGNVTNMYQMFTYSSSFNQPLNNWNVSNVTNMSNMFLGASNFNQAIGNWSVSNVTDMSRMFESNISFNQPIDNWNVINVTNMSSMFNSASNFNQAIGNWNVSSVTNMSGMFYSASLFNKSIENWNVGNVTNMSNMFYLAESFNKPLGNWNVSNVTNMAYMFSRASIFNQPIENWTVSSVTNMASMFDQSAFNKPLNNWNTSSLLNISGMFANTSFNQPIGNWNVSNVTNMSQLFRTNTSFNQPLNTWNVSNVVNMNGMFFNAQSFNQPLNNWNVSNVLNMGGMFRQSNINQNLSDWQFNLDIILTSNSEGFIDYTPMSVSNYDALLVKFNSLGLIDKQLSSLNVKYSNQTVRNNLINIKNWIITGDTYSAAPEPPTLTNSYVAPRKVKIDFTPSISNNVTGYNVYKSSDNLTFTFVTNTTSSSYTETGLQNGITYYYKIGAVNNLNQESASFLEVSATPTNIWYVATSGTSTGFGSANSPMNAIQTAIDASVSGEIVQVGNGTYTENIIYNGKNITVTSLFSTTQNEADITNTIIDGSGGVGFPVVRFHNGETNNAKLIGFTIQNGSTAAFEWGAGIDINVSSAQLKNLIIKNNNCSNSWPKTAGIHVVNASSPVLIENSTIKDNIGGAIYSLTGMTATLKISNCKIFNNTTTTTASAIYFGDQDPNLPIENTLIYNNISNNGGKVIHGSNVVLLNCTLYNNNATLNLIGNSGIINSIIGSNHMINNEGILKVHNSLIQDGQNSILTSMPTFLTYSNSISGNPLFVNPQQNDFHLSNYSPAIGVGISSISAYNNTYNAPTMDLESGQRPNPTGSNPDLGVFENSLAQKLHNNPIYVSNTTGSNTNSVGLQSAPFLTIQAAINYAIDGDTIRVLPGVYTELISVINKGVNIISDTPQMATIEMPSNGNLMTFSSNTGAKYSSVEGFKINQTGFQQSTTVRATDFHYVFMKKCKVTNFAQVFSTGVSSATATNCLFIDDAYIMVNDQCSLGIDQVTPSLKNCTIINATGIHGACPTISIDIINSIILKSNPNIVAYSTPPFFSKVITNDSFVVPQANSTFDVAPLGIDDLYFNDVANGDYTLKNYSPAIGYSYFPLNDDFNGNTRPAPTGTLLDAGAFENSLGTPSNAPPRIDQVANVTINEDAAQQTINLSGIADGDLLTTQTVTVSHTNSDAALFSDFTINHTASAATGTLVFTPAPNAFGTANITITVLDSGSTTNGGINSKTISFTITINPINDAPVALDDSILVNEGATIAVVTNSATTLTNNDTDVDNVSLTATIVTQPTNGTLTLNSNGTFSYTHNGSETTSDSFTYKSNDGQLDSNIATATIAVTPVNDAPVGNNDSFTVNEGATVTVLSNSQTSVLHNDTDAENNTLTVSVVATPTNGTLTLNSSGTFSYTHNDTETTTDSFTYKVNDGELDSNITTVNITINTVNDNGPTDITVSNFSLNENVSASTIGQFSVLDLDLPADTHAYELVSGTGDTNNSSFTINGTNLLNTAAFDYETNQTLSIRVKVTDANAVSYEKVFTINVDNVNDISITHTKTDSYCAGSAGNGEITINTVNQTMGSPTYSWTATNGGVIPTAQVNSQNLTSLPSGTYTVSITDLFFTYTQSFTIALIPQYADLSICYVSSDDTQVTKNRIYLNNQGNYNAANYEILRENNLGNFIPIGSISPDQNSYLDDSSNNTSFSSRYKVRLIDDCGNGLVNQTIHKTILLSANLGINNIVNLSWSKYVGTFYTTYFLYRKVNDGQFSLIYTTSASSDITSYNDQTADISINNYEYYVTIAVNTCSIQSRTTNNTIEVKSNRGIIGTNLAVNNFSIDNQIMLFPNPTTNLLNIKLNDGNELISGEVYNSLGQKVLTITNTPFSVEQLPSASYLIKVLTTQGQATKMFIKN